MPADLKTAIVSLCAAMLLLGMAGPTTAPPSSIVGIAQVEDGDSLRIRGTEIRLHGIDAPEPNQTCWDGERELACGRRAKRKLELAVRDREVSCQKRSGSTNKKLMVAVCYVDDADLGNIMVRSGWAVAFKRHGDMYVAAEQAAREAGQGLWRWSFTRPLFWRRLMRRAVRDPDSVSDGE